MTTRAPYRAAALRHDLARVGNAWKKSKRRRARRTIYVYLNAVFDLVMVWNAEGRAVQRATRALRHRGWEGGHSVEPFNAVIACTSANNPASRKERSKYARVLMFAAHHKSPDISLEAFILGNGGINACAALLA